MKRSGMEVERTAYVEVLYFMEKCLEILKSSLKIKVYRHFSSKKRYRRIPQNIVTDIKNCTFLRVREEVETNFI